MSELKTLFEKIWSQHLIKNLNSDGACLIHIDRHMVHECTSAKAFKELDEEGRKTRNPELTFAVIDHIISTKPGRSGYTFSGGKEFVDSIRKNCDAHGIELIDVSDSRQGIVHVIAPELGIALPGTTLVCGDSHTATSGALGCWAMGIGTSEVKHVLATQALVQHKPKCMKINFSGTIDEGVSPKDVILYTIGQVGVSAGRGYVVEYGGEGIRALEIEGRLTICNMSIELGARSGLIEPDDKTFQYLSGRSYSPKGAAWDHAIKNWRRLPGDPGAMFDKQENIDCSKIAPQVTWGTTPQDVINIAEHIPDPSKIKEKQRRESMENALNYMGLTPGISMSGLEVDVAFIGSCTNSRLSDLKEAAAIVKGRKVNPKIRALVVPGSAQVKQEAETIGLHKIFQASGFEWREAGCPMCVAVNDDQVGVNERSISTSNRNFENRQGPRSRTHLASPATVAATAVMGVITDPRTLTT